MAAFLDMGGFAAFVWPCYALSLGGMIWLGFASWRRARTTARQLAEMGASRADR
jgi:heme exporter protein CcmD